MAVFRLDLARWTGSPWCALLGGMRIRVAFSSGARLRWAKGSIFEIRLGEELQTTDPTVIASLRAFTDDAGNPVLEEGPGLSSAALDLDAHLAQVPANDQAQNPGGYRPPTVVRVPGGQGGVGNASVR